MDIETALEHLEPFAEAVLAFVKSKQDLGDVEKVLTTGRAKIKELQTQHAALTGQVSQLTVDLGKLKTEVEQVKAKREAEVAETERQQRVIGSQCIKDARDEVAKINAANNNVITEHKQAVASLQRQMDQLDDLIAKRRSDHEDVLASLESLKKRIG